MGNTLLQIHNYIVNRRFFYVSSGHVWFGFSPHFSLQQLTQPYGYQTFPLSNLSSFCVAGRGSDLKGTVSRDFLLLVFSWIRESAPEYPIRTVSNFFVHSRRYSQVKVHHRYQWHRWQIMGTLSGAETLKWTWRQKCIYKLTLHPKGVQTK
jgi:hypothetical protein